MPSKSKLRSKEVDSSDNTLLIYIIIMKIVYDIFKIIEEDFRVFIP